jgi:hypothetical protein
VRKAIVAAGLLFLAVSVVPAPSWAASPKGNAGTLVIVFRDGHRQTFNLNEIERVEFPGSAVAEAVPAGPNQAPRGRYFGKWEVGDGSGGTFYITLKENGEAYRTLGDVHGHWAYVNGEAQITWNDGAQDALRRVGGRFQKFAYAAGKLFSDTPDNVTDAHNTTPRPI